MSLIGVLFKKSVIVEETPLRSVVETRSLRAFPPPVSGKPEKYATSLTRDCTCQLILSFVRSSYAELICRAVYRAAAPRVCLYVFVNSSFCQELQTLQQVPVFKVKSL